MFYTNPKKCAFYTDRVIFFRFVVLSERVSTDPEKIRAITEQLQPQMIRQVKSFHGLASFYRWFIRNFSAIMAPITNFLKNEGFQSIPAATKTFKKVKKLMTEAHAMRLQDF